MMRSSRKMITSLQQRYRIFFLLLMVAALSACTRPRLPTWLGGAPPQPTSTPVAVTTELTLWQVLESGAEQTHLQSLLDSYQEQNSNIVVDLRFPDNYARRLRTAFSTDLAPDVFLLNLYQVPDFVQDGLLAPLPISFVADTDRYPQLQRAMQVDGTPYCIPHNVATLALFYNSSLFDEAGLAYPDATWQWTDLQAAATALTNLETNQFGLVVAADVSRWAAFLHQAGGTLPSSADPSVTVDSVEAETALDFYANLVLEGIATLPTTLNGRWPGEAFAQGRAAMMIEGNWAVPYLREEAPALPYGLTTLPVGPVGPGTVAFATCYAVAAQSEERAAATALISYLTAANVQATWIPLSTAGVVRPSLAVPWRTAHPTLGPFLDDINNAVAWQLPADFEPWVAEMNTGLRQIFGGFIPTSALLPQAETLRQEILSEE